MTEWFPLPSPETNIEDIIKLYSECLENFPSGNLKTEQDVWSEIDRLMYLFPSTHEYLEQYDPKEISCEIFVLTFRYFSATIFYFIHNV